MQEFRGKDEYEEVETVIGGTREMYKCMDGI